MRKIIFTFCFLATAALAMAQGPTAEDAIRSYKSSRKKTALDVFSFSYNVDRLAGAPDDMNLTWRSGGISFAFYFNQRLGKSNFSLAAGPGLSSRNYYQDYAFFGDSKTPATPFSKGALDSTVSLNKLVITTLDLPLEFRYTSRKIGKNTVLKFAAGVTLNFNLDAMRKTVYQDGLTIKTKGSTDLKNVNTFRAGFHARVGINKFALQYNQSFNPLFSNNGLTLTPYSIGLSLLL